MPLETRLVRGGHGRQVINNSGVACPRDTNTTQVDLLHLFRWTFLFPNGREDDQIVSIL